MVLHIHMVIPSSGLEKPFANVLIRIFVPFYKKYPKLHNAHLLVVGDVCIEEVETYTKKYFEDFPLLNTTPLHLQDFDQNSDIYIEKGKQTQNMLRLDWKLPNNDSNTINMFVIANWLESDAGPLYQELAIKKGWSNEIICEVDKKIICPKFSLSIYFSSEQSYEEIQNCALFTYPQIGQYSSQKV